MSGIKGKSGIYPLEKRGGLFKKGHKGFKSWLGKKLSKEHKKKLKENHKGMTGKHHTLIARKKISKAHKGEKSCLWKGGITIVRKQIFNSMEYRQWRSDVFTRDDFTCQSCRIRGYKLEAHHIKKFSVILEEYKITTLEEALICEELWNINNGKTLCLDCHNLTKNYEQQKC